MPNNASTQHTGQYKKLNNGSYGAKVNSLPSNISIGDVVMVTKRSGDVVTRYVERVLFACTNYRTGEATGETVVALKIPRRGRSTGRTTTSQVQDASQATRSASDPIVQGIMSAMERMPADVLRSLLVEGRLILERRGSSEETSKPSEEVSEESSEEVSEESSEEAVVEPIVETIVVPEIKTDFDDLWF